MVKKKYSDPLSICVLRNTLRNLRTKLQATHQNSFQVSRRRDLTDSLQPGELSEALLQIFDNTKIKVILCYGKTEVPDITEREHIISTLHDSLIGGHKGFHQTYRKIREIFYRKGMRNDIQNYVRTCASCQEEKIHRLKTRTLLVITDTPLEPFAEVSIDIMGPMRTTPFNYKYLLKMQCHLTLNCGATKGHVSNNGGRRFGKGPYLSIWSP